jgi:hypothetical protein
MPEKKTIKRARKAKRAGKSPSTQAGEFVREEIHHVRKGKHGAASTEQAIAIGLAKARRSGVKLGKPPKSSKKRSTSKSGRAAASSKSLSRHARAAAKRRTTGERRAAAKKAARTKGAAGRSAAAKKAARTRAKRAR